MKRNRTKTQTLRRLSEPRPVFSGVVHSHEIALLTSLTSFRLVFKEGWLRAFDFSIVLSFYLLVAHMQEGEWPVSGQWQVNEQQFLAKHRFFCAQNAPTM